MKDGFHVAIKGIDYKKAERLMANKKFRGIPIIYENPSGCDYQPCCSISPGDILSYSKSGRDGLYSGSVGSGPQSILGLTAAHSIETSNEQEGDIQLANRDCPPVSVCTTDRVILQVPIIPQETVESFTADLRLMTLKDNIKSKNEIQGFGIHSERIYKPTLYQDAIEDVEQSKILIRNKRRAFVEGVVESCYYNNKKKNLYQAITVINDPEGGRSWDTDIGDSGALAFLVPADDSFVVKVIGIVIGRTIASATGATGDIKTILNNLGDVLRHPDVFGGNSSAAGFYDHSQGNRSHLFIANKMSIGLLGYWKKCKRI